MKLVSLYRGGSSSHVDLVDKLQKSVKISNKVILIPNYHLFEIFQLKSIAKLSFYSHKIRVATMFSCKE